MERELYREKLSELEKKSLEIPNNRFALFCLTHTLTLLVLRWENIFTNSNLQEHPYRLAAKIIQDSSRSLDIIGDASVLATGKIAESPNSNEMGMEDYHKELFSDLWSKYVAEEYKKRINDYVYRLDINKIKSFVEAKKCIDFGCGHGNFAHALIEMGASSVLGIDYGEKNISYCLEANKQIKANNLDFQLRTVYETGQEDSSFDFAVQNGVFHHLDDEDKAYNEVFRVLRPGGWFWVYTDGIDNIQGEIQDTCARILSRYSYVDVASILDSMGLSIGKRYHLGDTMQATYRHVNLEDFILRLKSYGFDNYKRLVGGFSYDSDGFAAQDPWAVEKFGSGDIRVLVQKV